MFYTIVKVHFLTQNLKGNTSTMESFNSSLGSKSTTSYVNAKMANTRSSASLPPLPLWQWANRNAYIPIKSFSSKQTETSIWTKDHAVPIAGIETRAHTPQTPTSPLPLLYREPYSPTDVLHLEDLSENPLDHSMSEQSHAFHNSQSLAPKTHRAQHQNSHIVRQGLHVYNSRT